MGVLNVAQAEISINNEQLSINNYQLTINNGLYDISQDLGQTVGNNLFHNFDRFNLNTAETAQFSGDEGAINTFASKCRWWQYQHKCKRYLVFI
jgi:large exoprotein involved in heme utilization and adhesion